MGEPDQISFPAQLTNSEAERAMILEVENKN